MNIRALCSKGTSVIGEVIARPQLPKASNYPLVVADVSKGVWFTPTFPVKQLFSCFDNEVPQEVPSRSCPVVARY